MFYHLKIIVRNLQRGGIYSAINVGGLAIGMAAAMLILAWIYHEWSFDRFHAKEKQLYVAYNRATIDGQIRCWDWNPMPLGPSLKADYPEVAGVARMTNNTFLFTHRDAKFKLSTGCTDPDFLTMFDFPLLKGDRETALNDPYAVILTEKAALRLFGTEEPIGQTLLVDNQYSVMVTGVLKDFPVNTMLRDYEAFMPISIRRVLGGYNENWNSNNLRTFVELQPNVRLDLVNESIRNILNTHTNQTAQTELFLYPLNKRHLYSNFENGVPVGGLVDTLRLFGLIAGLILLIACINFMNLSTARSAKRAKEVGVRKVIGLFALVAYMAETRRKEIGIRKVLGASVGNVVILLSKEFLVLVVISVVIASPVAWWVMEK